MSREKTRPWTVAAGWRTPRSCQSEARDLRGDGEEGEQLLSPHLRRSLKRAASPRCCTAHTRGSRCPVSLTAGSPANTHTHTRLHPCNHNTPVLLQKALRSNVFFIYFFSCHSEFLHLSLFLPYRGIALIPLATAETSRDPLCNGTHEPVSQNCYMKISQKKKKKNERCLLG